MITSITSTYTQQAYRPGTPSVQDESARTSAESVTQPADAATSAVTGAGEPDLRNDQRVGSSANAAQLDPNTQEQQIIQELSARDREVRTHEQAHQNAGGSLTGAASYTYEKGPDGRLYAVGGEVSVQMPGRSGDPQRDIQMARQVASAALAPAEPSSQDRAVAQAARQIVNEAQAELSSLEQQEGENPLAAAQDQDTGQTGADQASAAVPAAAQNPAAVQAIASESVAPQLLSPESDSAGSNSERSDALVSRVGEFFDNLQQQDEARSQRLADYQASREELSQRLREFNQKLVDMGVLNSDYYVGSVINDQA
ncbi:putative metalloprotease CJM1_0395 family protein [Marinobacterium lutimaris]|uniref:SprA-related family protein n=1 Tax=Marinobacterium lutimaris TaxID=568106 RepID=A0A1H6CF24_9GAMM|nr:putative metalloprotease CJM1_0395 family protein [Marinobacterium lutimaris]SEG71630.1 SprA-related family protein [Marinobacterium lutimaris]